jgi:hypothetical protein
MTHRQTWDDSMEKGTEYKEAKPNSKTAKGVEPFHLFATSDQILIKFYQNWSQP